MSSTSPDMPLRRSSRRSIAVVKPDEAPSTPKKRQSTVAGALEAAGETVGTPGRRGRKSLAAVAEPGEAVTPRKTRVGAATVTEAAGETAGTPRKRGTATPRKSAVTSAVAGDTPKKTGRTPSKAKPVTAADTKEPARRTGRKSSAVEDSPPKEAAAALKRTPRKSLRATKISEENSDETAEMEEEVSVPTAGRGRRKSTVIASKKDTTISNLPENDEEPPSQIPSSMKSESDLDSKGTPKKRGRKSVHFKSEVEERNIESDSESPASPEKSMKITNSLHVSDEALSPVVVLNRLSPVEMKEANSAESVFVGKTDPANIANQFASNSTEISLESALISPKKFLKSDDEETEEDLKGNTTLDEFKSPRRKLSYDNTQEVEACKETSFKSGEPNPEVIPAPVENTAQKNDECPVVLLKPLEKERVELNKDVRDKEKRPITPTEVVHSKSANAAVQAEFDTTTEISDDDSSFLSTSLREKSFLDVCSGKSESDLVNVSSQVNESVYGVDTDEGDIVLDRAKSDMDVSVMEVDAPALNEVKSKTSDDVSLQVIKSICEVKTVCESKIEEESAQVSNQSNTILDECVREVKTLPVSDSKTVEEGSTLNQSIPENNKSVCEVDASLVQLEEDGALTSGQETSKADESISEVETTPVCSSNTVEEATETSNEGTSEKKETVCEIETSPIRDSKIEEGGALTMGQGTSKVDESKREVEASPVCDSKTVEEAAETSNEDTSEKKETVCEIETSPICDSKIEEGGALTMGQGTSKVDESKREVEASPVCDSKTVEEAAETSNEDTSEKKETVCEIETSPICDSKIEEGGALTMGQGTSKVDDSVSEVEASPVCDSKTVEESAENSNEGTSEKEEAVCEIETSPIRDSKIEEGGALTMGQGTSKVDESMSEVEVSPVCDSKAVEEAAETLNAGTSEKKETVCEIETSPICDSKIEEGGALTMGQGTSKVDESVSEVEASPVCDSKTLEEAAETLNEGTSEKKETVCEIETSPLCDSKIEEGGALTMGQGTSNVDESMSEIEASPVCDSKAVDEAAETSNQGTSEKDESICEIETSSINDPSSNQGNVDKSVCEVEITPVSNSQTVKEGAESSNKGISEKNEFVCEVKTSPVCILNKSQMLDEDRSPVQKFICEVDTSSASVNSVEEDGAQSSDHVVNNPIIDAETLPVSNGIQKSDGVTNEIRYSQNDSSPKELKDLRQPEVIKRRRLSSVLEVNEEATHVGMNSSILEESPLKNEKWPATPKSKSSLSNSVILADQEDSDRTEIASCLPLLNGFPKSKSPKNKSPEDDDSVISASSAPQKSLEDDDSSRLTSEEDDEINSEAVCHSNKSEDLLSENREGTEDASSSSNVSLVEENASIFEEPVSESRKSTARVSKVSMKTPRASTEVSSSTHDKTASNHDASHTSIEETPITNGHFDEVSKTEVSFVKESGSSDVRDVESNFSPQKVNQTPMSSSGVENVQSPKNEHSEVLSDQEHPSPKNSDKSKFHDLCTSKSVGSTTCEEVPVSKSSDEDETENSQNEGLTSKSPKSQSPKEVVYCLDSSDNEEVANNSVEASGLAEGENCSASSESSPKSKSVGDSPKSPIDNALRKRRFPDLDSSALLKKSKNDDEKLATEESSDEASVKDFLDLEAEEMEDLDEEDSFSSESDEETDDSSETDIISGFDFINYEAKEKKSKSAASISDLFRKSDWSLDDDDDSDWSPPKKIISVSAESRNPGRRLHLTSSSHKITTKAGNFSIDSDSEMSDKPNESCSLPQGFSVSHADSAEQLSRQVSTVLPKGFVVTSSTRGSLTDSSQTQSSDSSSSENSLPEWAVAAVLPTRFKRSEIKKSLEDAGVKGIVSVEVKSSKLALLEFSSRRTQEKALKTYIISCRDKPIYLLSVGS